MKISEDLKLEMSLCLPTQYKKVLWDMVDEVNGKTKDDDPAWNAAIDAALQVIKDKLAIYRNGSSRLLREPPTVELYAAIHDLKK